MRALIQRIAVCASVGAFVGLGLTGESAQLLQKGGPAEGPLLVHPANSRYFTDGTKLPDGSLKAVYLTGSHTWANLIDRGPSDPPPEFDFDRYLDFLQRHHQNFIRLWSRHVSWYHDYGEGVLHAAPLAWSRTGPGTALDGKPKFDLTQFHEPYFERLRSRVRAPRERGIYVGVMLFGGNYECQGGWRGNPFHPENNINGIDGDPSGQGHGLAVHTLQFPEINRHQRSYVRKFLDTLNDLDNTLYEISNEGHRSSAEWQQHWIEFIHQYEASKPKQHPVGFTALYIENPEENRRLLEASAAEWISPLTSAERVRQMPAAGGGKVSLLDSDHWFVKEIYDDPAFGREWVWKAFCRGHNPILMEHLPPLSFVDADYPLTTEEPGYTASRTAMGHTRHFAERMNLAAMKPREDLASTGFCLALPGKEYLVYQPDPGREFSLKAKPGEYALEWFDPVKGETAVVQRTRVSSPIQKFEPPFQREAVLYLKKGKE